MMELKLENYKNNKIVNEEIILALALGVISPFLLLVMAFLLEIIDELVKLELIFSTPTYSIIGKILSVVFVFVPSIVITTIAIRKRMLVFNVIYPVVMMITILFFLSLSFH